MQPLPFVGAETGMKQMFQVEVETLEANVSK